MEKVKYIDTSVFTLDCGGLPEIAILQKVVKTGHFIEENQKIGPGTLIAELQFNLQDKSVSFGPKQLT